MSWELYCVNPNFILRVVFPQRHIELYSHPSLSSVGLCSHPEAHEPHLSSILAYPMCSSGCHLEPDLYHAPLLHVHRWGVAAGGRVRINHSNEYKF